MVLCPAGAHIPSYLLFVYDKKETQRRFIHWVVIKRFNNLGLWSYNINRPEGRTIADYNPQNLGTKLQGKKKKFYFVIGYKFNKALFRLHCSMSSVFF